MPITYEPIATTTLGSAASAITFSSIPATYTDLRLVMVATASTGTSENLRFNSDSGTNYSRTRITGNGSTAASFRITDADSIVGFNGIETTIPALFTADVFSYAGNTNKTVLYTENTDRNGSGIVEYGVGLWRNTSAITNVSISTGS